MPERTEFDPVDAVAAALARARFGSGVDMGGAHNPLPSEYREATRLVIAIREHYDRQASS